VRRHHLGHDSPHPVAFGHDAQQLFGAVTANTLPRLRAMLNFDLNHNVNH
jgi:hypothetical protein